MRALIEIRTEHGRRWKVEAQKAGYSAAQIGEYERQSRARHRKARREAEKIYEAERALRWHGVQER